MRSRTGTSALSALPVRLKAGEIFLFANRKSYFLSEISGYNVHKSAMREQSCCFADVNLELPWYRDVTLTLSIRQCAISKRLVVEVCVISIITYVGCTHIYLIQCLGHWALAHWKAITRQSPKEIITVSSVCPTLLN